MWRFEGRGSLSGVSEGNAKIMVGNNKEEIPLAHHGDIKGAVQGLPLVDITELVI